MEVDFHNETEKILTEAEKEEEKYFFSILGKEFICYNGVFTPKYFSDPKFFIESLPIRTGDKFLEIGSGTGVISIFMKIKGASEVTAIDIDPLAIKNTEENVRLYQFQDKIEILQGNVFDPLDNQKFDIIFWNFPFGYVNEEPEQKRISVYNKRYEGLKKFTEGMKRHLRENGRVLVGFSTAIGNKKIFEEILNKNKLKSRLFKERIDKQGDEKAVGKKLKEVKYELFEIYNE